LRDGELGVSTLAQAAECTPTAASQHLSKLPMVRLVQQRADSRARLYRRSGGRVLPLLAEALAQADHTVSGVPPHS
jgi:DNA-binding transcriptional ArsR family regulator